MDRRADTDCPCRILAPQTQTIPLVIASPHSGRAYPAAFLAASRLDPLTLRHSEDSFVDELFAAAAAHGVPMLHALFPRAYVDPNREPFELDQAMFEDPLPDYVNMASPRVAAGLGTIARVVTDGTDIYAGKLTFTEVQRRIETFYRPYHAALRRLVEDTRRRFGFCLLIDCHSMPSVGGPLDRDAGRRRVDFVLGDCFGAACSSAVCETAERVLTEMGYAVAHNAPYAGGYTTQHYGRPADGVHALQIEINRALYMDEARFERTAQFGRLRAQMGELVARLGSLGTAALAAE